MLRFIMLTACILRTNGLLVGSTRKLSFLAFSSNGRGNKLSSIRNPSSCRFSTLSDELMQSILYRIRQCNNMPPNVQSSLMDFRVDDRILGKVTSEMARMLCNVIPPGRTRSIFIPSSSTENNITYLTLSEQEAGCSCDSRSNAVMEVMSYLRSKNVIKGWRDELYPLSDGYYKEPLLLVERAAAPFLGIQQYGVHINGLVKSHTQDHDGHEFKMWMARRSKTKSKYPSCLDHVVAGGQPSGLGLMENVLKECMEEAGIPQDLTLQGIRSVGAVSYELFEPSEIPKDSLFYFDGVVSRAVLFCYDLELPSDFVPRIVDGEVEEFFTWNMDQLLLSTKKDFHDPIKPNCYLVIIDFLLRQGIISPESRGYLDIVRELRGGLCA